jgi:hypothetical protein
MKERENLAIEWYEILISNFVVIFPRKVWNCEEWLGQTWWNILERICFNLLNSLNIQSIESNFMQTTFEWMEWLNCLIEYFTSSLSLFVDWIAFERKLFLWHMITITFLHISFIERICEFDEINDNRSDQIEFVNPVNCRFNENQLRFELTVKWKYQN